MRMHVLLALGAELFVSACATAPTATTQGESPAQAKPQREAIETQSPVVKRVRRNAGETVFYDYLIGHPDNTAYFKVADMEFILHAPLLPPEHPHCWIGMWLRTVGDPTYGWIIGTCTGQVITETESEYGVSQQDVDWQIEHFTNWATRQVYPGFEQIPVSASTEEVPEGIETAQEMWDKLALYIKRHPPD